MKENCEMNLINLILREAKKIAIQILNEKPSKDVKRIPKTQGVYLIYNKKGKIIYVGKSKNLKQRLSNHFSGTRNLSSDIFRKKLNRIYGISSGKSMKKWTTENCIFTYKEIKDKDLCSLVEAILISFLKKRGEPLLND